MYMRGFSGPGGSVTHRWLRHSSTARGRNGCQHCPYRQANPLRNARCGRELIRRQLERLVTYGNNSIAQNLLAELYVGSGRMSSFDPNRSFPDREDIQLRSILQSDLLSRHCVQFYADDE